MNSSMMEELFGLDSEIDWVGDKVRWQLMNSSVMEGLLFSMDSEVDWGWR